MKCLHTIVALSTLFLTGAASSQTSTVIPLKRSHAPVKTGETSIPPFTVRQLRTGATSETEVTATQLNPGGYWLLLYVDLHNPDAPKILGQLNTLAASPSESSTKPQLDPAKLVIVATHSTGAALSAAAFLYPNLATSAWTHDESTTTAKALRIRGTPHIFGMHAGLERWQFGGMLKESELQPFLLTWTGMNRLPANQMHKVKQVRPQSITPKTTTQGAPQ